MKIAQISPLYESVPPKLYGGTERIVAYLTDALVDLGHEVTLFAAGDAQTKAELIPVRDRSIRLDPHPLKSDYAANLAMLHEVHRHADEFDLLHFHIDLLHYPMFEDMAGRTLTTLHGRLDLKDLAHAYRLWPQFPLASISDKQRKPLAFANWVGTVHHGLPLENLRFQPYPQGGYLAFLGRIALEKRVDRAIEIARVVGIPLRIAAKVDASDRAYYEELIEPLIDGDFISYIGEITETEKQEFLGNAKALLFPIDWPEPFGLAMIEAMACGTPVIAWNCGSVPEVIEDGVTGRIINSVEEGVAAVKSIDKLSRSAVRAEWEKRFTAPVMAQRYVDLYDRLLGFCEARHDVRHDVSAIVGHV
jgi:glycosyltransferase involved in cell wall biosynthesis